MQIDLTRVSKRPRLSKRPKNDSRPWIEKYAPKKIESIAVNPQKIKQVESALRQCLQGFIKIIFLVGPTGTGKSTVARAVSRALLNEVFGKIEGLDRVLDYESGKGSEHFSKFLQECLILTHMKTVKSIIVDDLPNLSNDITAEKASSALLHWLDYRGRSPPLIICVSENSHGEEANQYVEKMFDKQVLNHSKVVRINFNKVTQKILEKVLKNILRNEGAQCKELQSFSFMGDISSAINGMEQKVKHGFSDVKDDDIGLFDAIGKVLYGSRNSRMRELIADQYKYIWSRFNLCLLENYTNVKWLHSRMDTKKWEALESIVDCLSDSDLLKDVYLPVFKLRYEMDKLEKLGNVDPGAKHRTNYFSKLPKKEIRTKFNQYEYFENLLAKRRKNYNSASPSRGISDESGIESIEDSEMTTDEELDNMEL
ncbi:BA75_05202T0 [Komagataella pastoris]|uniref:BA75_05202T0 n=1 Tax=Komagataella pastoris TaxID=4922 RepID=A0A1B2JHS8_PICPA|nr:BA75_05202T0 [Komagataella pastoris]